MPTQNPVVEFYSGLVADVYDIIFPPDKPQEDEELFAGLIARGDGPALEIGCGTGRLLFRLLKRGLDVEGLDLAPDMLKICRERGQAQGFEPVLYEASMVDFDLGKRYATVFVPFNSFQILTDRKDAQKCLETMFAHTAPGGQTILTTCTHWEDMFPGHLPGDRPWKLIRTGRDEARDLFVTSNAAAHVDRTEQIQTNWFRYDVYQGGRMVDSTSRVEVIRYYHKFEIQMMMERAGFTDVQVLGDEGDVPATDLHMNWVVKGTRRK